MASPIRVVDGNQRTEPRLLTTCNNLPTSSEPGSDVDPDRNRPDDLGEPVETIYVDIDYEILNHFSSHLYQSPNKAIEELVTNGFDAFAENVLVYTTGPFTAERVLVWDDGDSMGLEDLERLWWIARSPKAGIEGRVTDRGGRQRKMIGKFGIGKLASYAIGHRLTHLCKKDGQYLRVSVDYRGVPRLDEITKSGTPLRYPTPVVRLDEDEARQYVESLLQREPEHAAAMWGRATWTLAMIDELKPDVSIQPGRLRWLLSTGMPLRDDFRVWVDEVEVVPTLEADAVVTWNLSEPKLRERIGAEWRAARDDGFVVGDPSFEPNAPRVELPGLGAVEATVKLFNRSLIAGKAAQLGRSHGFFIRVRDRLMNPDDDKVLLHEPSFGTFYRSQFVIRADGLDAALLADRERLETSSPATAALAVLQRALYLAAREELNSRDERKEEAKKTENVLPFELRGLYREPLVSLLLRRGFGPRIDPSTPAVNRGALGLDEPLVALDDRGFVINYSHPLLEAIQRRIPQTEKYREAYRVVELFAVADELLEGYLFDIGVPEERIDAVMRWRDGLLRAMAAKLTGADEEVIADVREASYRGKADFEKALASLLGLMGFEAKRVGAAGEEDVLVVAPIGPGDFRFIVDAKGSKNPVPNDNAELGPAAGHRDAVGAGWAVVVAREFVGFTKGDAAAVLRDCEAVGKVSVVTVDALVELYRAVKTYYYPLELVRDVLWTVETPKAKHDRIGTMQHPVDDFDFRSVLNEIWRAQSEEASGFPVPILSVMFTSSEWKAMGEQEFEQRLLGMETLARGLIRIGDGNVTILQSPANVAEQIQVSVEAVVGDAD
jgi:hypothetical protein